MRRKGSTADLIAILREGVQGFSEGHTFAKFDSKSRTPRVPAAFYLSAYLRPITNKSVPSGRPGLTELVGI